MRDHEAAHMLFDNNISGKEIARTLNVSVHTIASWKKKYGWKKKKSLKTMARATAEETLWGLINYQLNPNKKKKLKWEKEGGVNLIDKGDINAQTKMFSAIEGKQLEWSNYVKVCQEMLDYIQSEDLELANQILEYVEIFLNNKRKEL